MLCLKGTFINQCISVSSSSNFSAFSIQESSDSAQEHHSPKTSYFESVCDLFSLNLQRTEDVFHFKLWSFVRFWLICMWTGFSETFLTVWLADISMTKQWRTKVSELLQMKAWFSFGGWVTVWCLTVTADWNDKFHSKVLFRLLLKASLYCCDRVRGRIGYLQGVCEHFNAEIPENYVHDEWLNPWSFQ